MPVPDDTRTCRPREILTAIGQRYPHAWKICDEFRAGKGGDLPDWPDWCFLPLPAMYPIVSDGLDVELAQQQAWDLYRLGALSGWRMTQGLYRFDPAVFEAIADTPITGDLPHEILFRLPEWCVYVETPGLLYAGDPLQGFFAHLDFALDTGAAELRLLLDANDSLDPLSLPLGPWPLAESIARALASSGTEAARSAPAAAGAGLRAVVEPLVSLLLYLCSQAAEIGDGNRHPGNPQPKKTKRGPRLFQAVKPNTWDVGVRLGSALRRAYHARDLGQQAGTGVANFGPHVRRMHWHLFWTGPRDGKREANVRWMPPIPVLMDGIAPEDLPTVVRPVR